MSSKSPRQLKSADLSWADVVMVMEREHRRRICRQFPDLVAHVSMYVLEIPDDFQFMDPELVELLRERVPEVLDEHQRIGLD